MVEFIVLLDLLSEPEISLTPSLFEGSYEVSFDTLLVPVTVPGTPIVVLPVEFLPVETGVVLFVVPEVVFDEVLFEFGLSEFCSTESVELEGAEVF